jgi:hypothetical protein
MILVCSNFHRAEVFIINTLPDEIAWCTCQAAAERRENTLKGVNVFYLKAKAIIWRCLACAIFARKRTVYAYLHGDYLTESVYAVVLQESIPAQICQSMLHFHLCKE